MTNSIHHILAADDSVPPKVIFIVVAVVIWFISSVVSSIRKVGANQQAKKQKTSLRATRQSIQLPALAQSHPNWKGGRTPSKAAAPAKPSAKRRPPPIPAKAPAAEPEPIMMQVVESVVSQAAQTAQRKPTRATTAGTLHRWLTPKTLRQQFMLTEVLRPPIALRADERE